MIDAEQICAKAKSLDPSRLQTLAEFLDILMTRRDGEAAGDAFAQSAFEDPTAASVYQGKPLTLEQMRTAVDWYEAGMDFADALHLALAGAEVGLATLDQGIRLSADRLDLQHRVVLISAEAD